MEDEDTLFCPYCGSRTEVIVDVEDNDPEVGYHAVEEMCPACIRASRLACCEEAQLSPLTPLLLGWPPDQP